MGEGDEISVESQEELNRRGLPTSYRNHGPLQRYINKRLDVGLYMVGGSLDAIFSSKKKKSDPDEDTPAEAAHELEVERQGERNPDHPGEQISGTL